MELKQREKRNVNVCFEKIHPRRGGDGEEPVTRLYEHILTSSISETIRTFDQNFNAVNKQLYEEENYGNFKISSKFYLWSIEEGVDQVMFAARHFSWKLKLSSRCIRDKLCIFHDGGRRRNALRVAFELIFTYDVLFR